MALLCIAIPVPAPCGPLLDEARARLQPGRRHMPAHVTLVAPMRTDNAAEISAQVRDAVAGMAPFELTLDGTGTFLPESRVVFLVPTAGRDGCERLRSAVARGLLETEAQREFHPHVTLANRCGPEVLDRAEREFAGFLCTFTVDRVAVYEHGPDGWQVVSEARMGMG